MIRPNDPPDAPEWAAEPKPWDEKFCCPATCPGICESPQQAVWMHGSDEHLVRGEN